MTNPTAPGMTREQDKVCNGCGESLPINSFHKNGHGNGRRGVCKKCYWTKYGEKQKNNRKTDSVREKRRVYYREIRNLPSERERMRVAAATYQRKYPEKGMARTAVRKAIRDGLLTRPETCQKCGAENPRAKDGRPKIQAHHHDYSKPLEVEWLCALCHIRDHAGLPLISALDAGEGGK